MAILGTGETAWIPKIATPDGTECANKLNVDVIIQFIDLSCSSYIPNRRNIKCRPFIYLIQKYFIILDNYSVIQNERFCYFSCKVRKSSIKRSKVLVFDSIDHWNTFDEGAKIAIHLHTYTEKLNCATIIIQYFIKWKPQSL